MPRGRRSALRITRATLLNGKLLAAARRMLGPGVRLMTPAERREHVREMLEQAPEPRRVWVFGYGSSSACSRVRGAAARSGRG